MEYLNVNFSNDNSNCSKSKYTVSILTASLNEVDNIEIWLNNILHLFKEKKINDVQEIIIVDDGSTDGTIEKIKDLKEKFPLPISLIQRNKKMGTVNAQIIGSTQSKSDYVLIMDCDLQHPIEQIPLMLSHLNDDIDAVIGSRYITGGNNDRSLYRGLISRVATFIAHLIIPRSRRINDPLSGYFVIKRKLISNLTPHENLYKLLLFSIAVNVNMRILEVPISFHERLHGSSKVVNDTLQFITKYLRELLIFWVNGKKSRKKHL